MGLLADTLRVERHTWDSRFKPEPAAARLRDVGLNRGREVKKGADLPLVGRSGPPIVVARRRAMLPNAWQPVFRGRLVDHGKGSRLTATIRPAAWTYFAYGVWFAITLVGAVVGVVAAINESTLIGLLFPVFPLLAIAVTMFSGYRCRGDRELISTTIRSAINGIDVATQGATS